MNDFAVLKLRVETDADWVALNVYRMALERIAQQAEEERWAFAGEDAGEIARQVLTEFPGSAK